MDIDEFLDKEVQATEKEDIEKDVSSQEIKEVDVEKETTSKLKKERIIEELSSSQPIKEEGSIKSYFDLWNKVSEAKFKWDNDLYNEVDKAAVKVKEELSSSLLTIEREKNAIKRLISKALTELRHNNYEAATKLYSQISDTRNKFPDYFLEEKKELNRDIFRLYQKLHDQIDSKFIIDFKESIEKINSFIRDAFSNLDNDIDKAKNFYEKALELYKDLPNGFLPQKLELGKQLLTLYKDLSVHTQIENLQSQLSKKAVGYKYISSDDRLKRLSEIIKTGHIKRPSLLRPEKQGKTLLPRLIERKLDRARVNLKKGLYLEAKKNIEAILRVDSENEEAKELLKGIPIEY